MANAFQIYRDQLNHFVRLSDADWLLLKGFLCEEKYVKNDFYMKEGEICKTVSFIVEGAFKSYHEKGNEIIINDFFNETDFVIEVISFLKQQSSDSSIIACKDSIVLSISYKNLQEFCDCSEQGNRLIRKIYEYYYLKRFEQEVVLRLVDSKTRLQYFIKAAPLMFESFSQKEIASYLKMSQETLSRIKKQIYASW